MCLLISFFFSPYRSESYDGASNFNALLTPLTFLVSYFNSAINPFLYAFLSRNFRKGMRELLLCSFKKAKSQPVKQQRIPLNVSIIFDMVDLIAKCLVSKWISVNSKKEEKRSFVVYTCLR